MSSTPAAAAAHPVDRLRRLYLGRFLFALVWAAVFLATGAAPLGGVAVVLLVLYPAVDVVAAVLDARSSHPTGSARTGLRVNVAVSSLAAVGLVLAGGDATSALRVWGAWAVLAGLVQLAVALSRRALGGQRPMVLSGGISVLAGASFIASADDQGTRALAGYALLGGLFFLVSALRLRRDAADGRAPGVPTAS